jgi:hypothetical protein
MDTIGLIELPGSTFLYTLAIIAIMFVGFSSVVGVIRQTMGAALSRFQILLARTYIELGFVVVGLALLPMFLSLFALPHSSVLSISSAVAAVVLVMWLGFFARRYRKTGAVPLPAVAWLHLVIGVVVVVGLVLNAAGYPSEPHVGLYALALGFVLAEAVDTFLHSMNILLRQSKAGAASDDMAKP